MVRITALGFNPNSAARRALMTSTAAAPSEIWEEIPGVITPFGAKTGARLLSASIEVSRNALVLGQLLGTDRDFAGVAGTTLHEGGQDLTSEPARVAGRRRLLVAGQRELVEGASIKSPASGDHLG
jgi:hypothetical protein